MPKKKLEEKPIETTEPVQPVEAPETVTMSKEQFDQMMARLEAIESKGGTEEIIGADIDSDRPSECSVKTIDMCLPDAITPKELKEQSEAIVQGKRPISLVHHVRVIGKNENGDQIMRAIADYVAMDGTRLQQEIDYVKYRDLNGDPGKIIRREVQKKVKKGSMVSEQVFNPSTNVMQYTGREVRLADNYSIIRHVVEWNGETVTLDEVN